MLRVKRVVGPWLRLLASSATVAAALAWAAPVRGQESPAALLRQAYRASQAAATDEELSQIIELCRQALEGELDDEAEKYGRELMSWTYNKRGEVRSAAGSEAEALADFERAVSLDGARWRAIHNRGVSYAQLGNYAEAEADFDRTIELEPAYANAWFNRGELRYRRGDLESAIADYDQALKLRPDDSAALVSRGYAHHRRANYRQALSDFTEAIQIDPSSASAHAHRADLFADLSRYADAADDYRAALRADPKYGRGYQRAAWFIATCPDERFRDPEKAVRTAEYAIELDADADYSFFDTAAAAYAANSQFDRAIESQSKAIEMAAQQPPEVVERLQQRLALYQTNQPYLRGKPTTPP